MKRSRKTGPMILLLPTRVAKTTYLRPSLGLLYTQLRGGLFLSAQRRVFWRDTVPFMWKFDSFTMHTSAKVLSGILRSHLQNLKRLAWWLVFTAWRVWILYGYFWRSFLVILFKANWHRFGRGFLANVWRTTLIFLPILAVRGLPEPSLLRWWTVPVCLNFSLILQMVYSSQVSSIDTALAFGARCCEF